MRRLLRSTLALSCTLALAGCHDHRLGFFPETDGDASGTWTTETTTLSPTTVSPTTVSPTTVSPTVTVSASDTETPVTVTSIDPTGGGFCADASVGPQVPLDVFGSLAGEDDDFTLSCGGAGGSDFAVLWQAPFTGRFQFDTIGSNFDTLLGLFDGDCSTGELACDDDSGGELRSKLVVDLTAGQVVTVVVDSFGQSTGEFALRVRDVSPPDECPDAVFETVVPLEINGQTAGAGDSRAGSCGGEGSPDIEAMWTAPFTGLFTFRVTEADFDPVLYLRTSCDGPEIICNDDSFGVFPVVSVALGAGQQVVIVVDGVGGQSGKFVLVIEEGS
jgi:hypothetical protein